MNLFKRILVPIDLSEKSQNAVDVACKLAAGNGEILLLHVIETVEHIEFEDLRSFYSKLEKSALAGLRRLADQAPHQGVTVHAETVYGKRARSIIEFAAKRDVDLIVVNSHRLEPDSGFPSISYEVSMLAPCPVLLLK